MQKFTADTFHVFLTIVEKFTSKKPNLILYRGQSDNSSLIPSIARSNPAVDTTDKEKQMIEELRRRSKTMLKNHQFDEWEWLIYAQHFGMKTRLLDWTSNPLAALWFACSNEYKIKQDSFVYVLAGAQRYLLDKTKEKSPFNNFKTRVLKPELNNERIIAQSGWFTAHKFSRTAGRFVDLKTNKEIKNSIAEITIPQTLKLSILDNLNVFGLNNQSIYPDITGMCKHLNWEFGF